MNTIRLEELQQNTDALLERVEAGENLVVTRDGRPVAEWRSIAPVGEGPRPFGLCAGEFSVPGDFDAPLPDDNLRDFEGGG